MLNGGGDNFIGVFILMAIKMTVEDLMGAVEEVNDSDEAEQVIICAAVLIGKVLIEIREELEIMNKTNKKQG